MVKHYDAILVGSGQGGTPMAFTLAGKGKKTALIEREHLGGTCVNEGCTPTKTMVASARMAHLAGRASDYGVNLKNPIIDLQIVRKRKRDIVDSFRSGSESAAADTENLFLLEADASFSGEKELTLHYKDGKTEKITGDMIFIDTGTRPALPPVPGLDDVPYLTSTSIMELDIPPEHLIIIGGGYIGLEFGQMFSRFGSNVTIINRGGQLASREDADIAEAIQNIFEDEGINILLNTSLKELLQQGDGSIAVRIDCSGEDRELTGSHVLIAAGRTPNTDSLNPAAGGVKTDDRGFIEVNDRLETSEQNIWALGDVTGGPMFTHISYDHFRIINTNLFGPGGASTTGRLVPYTMFIDPQLGRVGMSEKEARNAGIQFHTATLPMTHVARALEVDETRGMMKAVVEEKTDRILGFACLGIEGGEVMGAVQIAMMGELPYTAMRDAAFAHPTLIESLNNLFAQL